MKTNRKGNRWEGGGTLIKLQGPHKNKELREGADGNHLYLSSYSQTNDVVLATQASYGQKRARLKADGDFDLEDFLADFLVEDFGDFGDLGVFDVLEVALLRGIFAIKYK